MLKGVLIFLCGSFFGSFVLAAALVLCSMNDE